MQKYPWPGNVRELQNYIERAVVMARGDEFTLELLPTVVTTGRAPRSLGSRAMDFQALTDELVHRGLGEAGEADQDLLSRIVEPVERRVIAEVMTSTDRVQIKAAARLGINRNTLHKKLKQYGLDGET